MSVIPSGVSIQEIYRRYREGQIIVNRKYQRKLLWTEEEKANLIDSIMKGYPIPLILFAEHCDQTGIIHYEILDGLQRLNAIVGFIENEFKWDGKYFDINQLARAKQAFDEGLFMRHDNGFILESELCANFLDYQLAVTSFKVEDEEQTFEIFGRINSGGRQLSSQERRQAGVICDFTTIVRTLAAEIRGDSTDESVPLSEMPQISIGSLRNNEQYGIRAEETFWVRQGILSVQDLRNSDDEEFIADIAASILLDEPFARSKENLDKLYDVSSDLYEKLSIALKSYTSEKLKSDIQNVFAIIEDCVESVSNKPNYLRDLVTDSKNPIKNAFYTIFMAFYELIVKEGLSPCDSEKIMQSIENLQSRIKVETHYATTNGRRDNIGVTKGLIKDQFVKKEPPVLGHGSSLSIDFENSIRRSKIETPRYEFKQGFLRLYGDRNYDKELEKRILNTICGMANIGPNADGYIFLGVSDTKEDAKRIEELDHVFPREIAGHFVVGIDREAELMGKTVEDYCALIMGFIKTSELSDSLKMDVLSNIDIIDYRSMSVIRIKVPAQKEMSFISDEVYIRQGNETTEVISAKDIANIAGKFT